MGFRENLRSELDYSGMTVKELAALAGVKKHSIDNYVNARGQIPSAEVAAKIAQALGVSVEYLVNGGKDGKACFDQRLSKQARQIGQLVEDLDEDNRQFVLDFIKWLKARRT